MHKKIRIGKIHQISSLEYRKWIANPRAILLLCFWCYMNTSIIMPLCERAVSMDAPLNILEPLIAGANSSVVFLLFPLLVVTMLADFPRIDGGTLFVIFRSGRLNWLFGEVLFLIESVATCIAFFAMSCILPMLNKGFFYDGWSEVITEYNKLHPGQEGSYVSQMITENLYYQVAPFKAAVLSLMLLFFMCVTLGIVLLLFYCMDKKFIGIVVNLFIIVAGSGFSMFHSKVQWLFPTAHGTLSCHFITYFRKMNMPLSYSVIYFIAIGILLLCISIYKIEKLNFTFCINKE